MCFLISSYSYSTPAAHKIKTILFKFLSSPLADLKNRRNKIKKKYKRLAHLAELDSAPVPELKKIKKLIGGGEFFVHLDIMQEDCIYDFALHKKKKINKLHISGNAVIS